jgi:hypothetical protein
MLSRIRGILKPDSMVDERGQLEGHFWVVRDVSSKANNDRFDLLQWRNNFFWIFPALNVTELGRKFHQHLTCSKFVCKLIEQSLFLLFWLKEMGGKGLLEMLVKSTTV